jgi:hypothetical protein
MLRTRLEDSEQQRVEVALEQFRSHQHNPVVSLPSIQHNTTSVAWQYFVILRIR